MRRPSYSVSAIGQQKAPQRPVTNVAMGDRQINPMDRMHPELRRQCLFRKPRSRKHDETAGLFIQSVHDSESRADASGSLSTPLEPRPHSALERVGLCVVVGNRTDAGRLAHDNHVGIDVNYRTFFELGWTQAASSRVDAELIAQLHARGDVGNYRTSNRDFSASDPIPGSAPGRIEEHTYGPIQWPGKRGGNQGSSLRSHGPKRCSS